MTLLFSRSIAAVLIAFVVMLLSVTEADRQIYDWRDADGALVVSDRPPSSDVTTVGVAGTTPRDASALPS